MRIREVLMAAAVVCALALSLGVSPIGRAWQM